MRRISVLSALLLAACATRSSGVSFGSVETNPAATTSATAGRDVSQQRLSFATAAIPNSALDVATRQLESHGYQVGAKQGDVMIATTAREIPAELDTTGIKTPLKNWILRVVTMRDEAGRSTGVDVAGFLIPADSTRPAIPITSRHRPLYQEVQMAAALIQDSVPAARRRR
jgi:hypothetical protein